MSKAMPSLRTFRSPYFYGLEHIIDLHTLIGHEIASIGRETPTFAPKLDEHAVAPNAATSKVLAVTNKQSYTTTRMEEIS